MRLSSPLLHSVTAYVIFRTARVLFDGRTGLWAAAIYLLMPALWLSSGIVSTDVPLLLCWAVALNAWVHLREEASWLRAMQLGLAVGLGILSKYAMLFFLPALGLAFLFDPDTRRGLNTIKGYTAGLLTLGVVTPNIYWNINHDFATLTHTAANANWDLGSLINPGELFSFWSDQLAVFGPVTLVLMLMATLAAFRKKLDKPSLWLAAFTLSPLIIISAEAFLARANANWAVTAYVAAPTLTSHYVIKNWPRLKKWLVGGVGIQTAISLPLALMLLAPGLTNQFGLANSVKHLRAWPDTVSLIEATLEQGHDGQEYKAVATDKRIIFYDLKYYDLEATIPLRMWRKYHHPEHQADLKHALEATDGPVLIVNYYSPDVKAGQKDYSCLLYTSPSPRDATLSRMPSSA